MNRTSMISGAVALTLAAGAAVGLVGPESQQLTGSFESLLLAQDGPEESGKTSDKNMVIRRLDGGSFGDLQVRTQARTAQPEVRVKKPASGEYKVYVKVVGPDGEVREWTVGGDSASSDKRDEHEDVHVIVEQDGDGKHIVRKKVIVGGEPHVIRRHSGEGEGGKIIVAPKGKVLRFRSGGQPDIDIDFDFDFEFEDGEAIDVEAIKKQVRRHVEKATKHAEEARRLADDIKKEIRIKVRRPHGEHTGPHEEHMQKLHERLKNLEGKVRSFGGEDAEFDFDIDLEGVPSAEEIESIVEKAMKGAKVWRQKDGKPRVFRFDGNDIDFQFKGVPDAEEIKKLIDRAIKADPEWNEMAPGVFKFDADDFDFGDFDWNDVDWEFDADGLHEHLHEHLQDALNNHLHERGHQSHVHEVSAVPVTLAWAGQGAAEQPEVVELKKGDDSYNVIIQKQDGDNNISVQIKNGKATAKVNGKEVPQDRVKMSGGKVTVLGADGEKIATFPMVVSPNVTGAWTTSSPRGMVWDKDEAFGNFTFQADDNVFGVQDPPPVMLGITMASPGESVARHFDLEEGQGIEIQTVIEGLPAAEAGLKAKDIIVKVEGAENVTPETLRMVLRKKQPGDEIKVKVLRQGETEQRVIKLREYDAERLGVTIQVEPQVRQFWQDDDAGAWTSPDVPRQFWGEFEKSMKEHFSDNLHEHLSERQMGEAKKAFEEAIKHLKTAPNTRHRLKVSPDGGQWLYLQGEDGGNREFFALPRSGVSAGPGDINKEIAGLKQELAEVRRQRDEMAQELREIKDLLKKLAGDRD